MIRKFEILWSKCQEFGVQNVRNLRHQIKLDNMHKHIISIFEPEIFKSLSIFEPEAQIKYIYKKKTCKGLKGYQLLMYSKHKSKNSILYNLQYI